MVRVATLTLVVSVLVFKFEIAVCKFSDAPDKKANVVVLILFNVDEKVNVDDAQVLDTVVVVPENVNPVSLVAKFEICVWADEVKSEIYPNVVGVILFIAPVKEKV